MVWSEVTLKLYLTRFLKPDFDERSKFWDLFPSILELNRARAASINYVKHLFYFSCWWLAVKIIFSKKYQGCRKALLCFQAFVIGLKTYVGLKLPVEDAAS